MTAMRESPTESEREPDAPAARPPKRRMTLLSPMIWRESDFAPVEIRGKTLSQTMTEERREARC